MSDDATLTKTEKNVIFEVVQHSGLDASTLEWKEVRSNEFHMGAPVHYRASLLTHVPTGFSFLFGGEQLVVSPYGSRKIAAFSHGDDWGKKLMSLSSWLDRVKEEYEAPDLWATVRQEQALGNAASSVSANEAFSLKEKVDIGQKIDEIEHYLIEDRHLREEQTVFVQHEMVYLKKAADRLGRKDWLNVALAVLVNVATTLALDNHNIKGLMGLAGSLFQSLWAEFTKLIS